MAEAKDFLKHEGPYVEPTVNSDVGNFVSVEGEQAAARNVELNHPEGNVIPTGGTHIPVESQNSQTVTLPDSSKQPPKQGGPFSFISNTLNALMHQGKMNVSPTPFDTGTDNASLMRDLQKEAYKHRAPQNSSGQSTSNVVQSSSSQQPSTPVENQITPIQQTGDVVPNQANTGGLKNAA